LREDEYLSSDNYYYVLERPSHDVEILKMQQNEAKTGTQLPVEAIQFKNENNGLYHGIMGEIAFLFSEISI